MFIKYIVSFLVFLFAFLAGNISTFAQSANSILNTTVRKTSASGLNVTFYTKSENSEVPIVKDKGNNQYVILLPNVSDLSGSRPDFRTASDLVSDVQIKTINEGAVTYTKVTLTTKRPVKLNAETRRTSQTTSELSGLNDIVSKANLINQGSVANIQPVSNVISPEQPKVSTLPKMNSVQDILNNKNLIASQKATLAKEIPAVATNTASKKTQNNIAAHVPSDTKTIKRDTQKLQNENIKNVKKEAIKNVDKIEKNIKTSVEHNILVNEDESEVELPPLNGEAETIEPIKEVVAKQKNVNISKAFSSPIMLVTLLLMGIAALILFILNKVKSSMNVTADINNSFIERMNSAIPSQKKDFSEIAQNQSLNWQEKYASFKEGKALEQQKEINSHIGADPDDDLDIVEEVSETPIAIVEEQAIPVETPESPNPFASNYQNVHSAGDVIAHSMKRSVGLTSFEDSVGLVETRRNTGLRNRLKSFESNAVEGLNRNMSALLDTVIRMEEEKPAIENTLVTDETQSIKTSESPSKEIKANATSPIEKAQAPIKKKMKIKESRAIDENRGFYLVDMEDKLALMGRINDKFTVLKKFDDKEKTTLQVRRDKDNLYMVRTDGFKALVDVEGSKMGVLAEL